MEVFLLSTTQCRFNQPDSWSQPRGALPPHPLAGLYDPVNRGPLFEFLLRRLACNAESKHYYDRSPNKSLWDYLSSINTAYMSEKSQDLHRQDESRISVTCLAASFGAVPAVR